MRLLRLLVLLLFAQCATAQQFYVSSAPTGQMVLVGFEGSDYPWLNVIKSCGSLQTVNGFAYPGVLDENNYPVSGNLSQNIFCTVQVPVSYAGSWTLDWTASGSEGNSSNPAFQIQSGTGAPTVTGAGCAVSGGTTFTLSVYGGSICSFTFSFTTPPSTFSLVFLGGASFASGLNLRLYKTANQSLINSGQIFDPDFLSAVSILSPSIIRTLGWNDVNDSNNFTTASLQTPVNAMTYSSSRWDSTVWAGTIAAGDAYTATLTGSGCLDGSNCATILDGQTVQGQMTNANTTTSPTLKINSGTAYPIYQMDSTAPTVGFFPAGCMGTFIFDSILGGWLGQCSTATGFGITSYVPLSVQVALANQINKHLWFNWPCHITNAAVTSMATTIKGQLPVNRNLYSEYCNEVWNFAAGFPQSTWAQARGSALGIVTEPNAQAIQSFYGLRTRQIQGLVTTVWNGQSNLKRVLAFQASGPTSSTNQYRLQGADLCGTSCSNSTYQSLVGTDYNSSPNRPVDYADVFSYAQYTNGAVLNDGNGYSVTFSAADLAGCSTPGTNSGGLQCMADNYNSSATSAAFAWIDNDVRQGNVNGSLGGNTLKNYSNTYIQGWNTINSTGNTGGTAYNLPIIEYEGAFSGLAPTVAQCQASPINGVNSTLGTNAATYCGPSGLIQQALTAYKKTGTFQSMITTSLGLLAASSAVVGSLPAQFLLSCSGCQWGLYIGDIYSTKFTSYAAQAAFN